MTWMHPVTFVFILIIALCIGFAFGFRAGVSWCNAQLKGISDEMKKVADQLGQRR